MSPPPPPAFAIAVRARASSFRSRLSIVSENMEDRRRRYWKIAVGVIYYYLSMRDASVFSSTFRFPSPTSNHKERNRSIHQAKACAAYAKSLIPRRNRGASHRFLHLWLASGVSQD